MINGSVKLSICEVNASSSAPKIAGKSCAKRILTGKSRLAMQIITHIVIHVPMKAPNVPSYDFRDPGHLCFPKYTPNMDAAASPMARTLFPQIRRVKIVIGNNSFSSEEINGSDKVVTSFGMIRTGNPSPSNRNKCVKINSLLSRSSIKAET